MLKSGNDERVNLMNSNCKINPISSWYIDCDGSKVTATSTGISMENTFEIEQDSHVYDFEVKKYLIYDSNIHVKGWTACTLICQLAIFVFSIDIGLGLACNEGSRGEK